MKITKQKAKTQNWDKVKSWNYKLNHLDKYKSVIYAEIIGDHGRELSGNIEQIYYIVNGEGKFIISNNIIEVKTGDVITIPPNTNYNYSSINNTTLKIVSFAELWDN